MPRRFALSLVLGAAMFGAMLLSLCVGPAGFDIPGWQQPAERIILLDVRLPRVLAAVLAGLALGLSGAAMQGMLRNPLAEPGTMGVSASAALAATLTVYSGMAGGALWVMPVAAVAGALGAALLIGALALRHASTATLLLAGLALSALAGAGMAVLVNLAPNPFSLADLISWTAGSVANRDWLHLMIAAPPIAAGVLLLLGTRRQLSALLFDDDVAASVGVDLRRMRAQVVLGTALATGGAVALAGVIGFVGLIAPHAARMLAGAEPGRILLPSALISALLLLCGDALIRCVSYGPEWHLGTLTALIGAPLFLLIALRTHAGEAPTHA